MALRSTERETRRLILYGLAIVCSFALGTVYSSCGSARASDEAQSIAADTIPSIAHLLAVAEVSQEMTSAASQLIAEGATARGPAASRQRLERELASYRPLATWAGEAERARQLEAHCRRAIRAYEAIVATVAAHDVAASARIFADELAPAAGAIDAAVAGLVRLNLAEGYGRANRVLVAQARARRVAVALDVFAAVLAAAAGAAVVRASRRETRARDAHDALREARSTELDAFAERAAHDVLSPLATTSLALDVALRHPDTPDAQREALALGRRALQHASEVVGALLAFSRAGGQPTADARAPLVPLAREVLDELRPAAERARVALALEPCAPCTVACSPGLVRGALTNLVENAIKYMGDVPRREVVVRITGADTRVRVEVRDSGPGVPAEWRDRIFLSHVRGPAVRGQAGVGLGLATAKRSIEAHGGRIGVEPAPGGGSCFWFELPEATVAPAA